jgi:hypothetical protein
MRRRLFTIIAAVSAVICLLAFAMRVRGFFASDVWASHLYTPPTNSIDSRSVEATDGWLLIIRSTMLLPPGTVPGSSPPLDSTWLYESGPPNIPPNLPPGAEASLVVWHSFKPPHRSGTTRAYQVGAYSVAGVRLLLVIALSSLLPALWIWLLIRDRRRATTAGCCPTCGYDMRASPQRCPECGAIRANATHDPLPMARPP